MCVTWASNPTSPGYASLCFSVPYLEASVKRVLLVVPASRLQTNYNYCYSVSIIYLHSQFSTSFLHGCARFFCPFLTLFAMAMAMAMVTLYALHSFLLRCFFCHFLAFLLWSHSFFYPGHALCLRPQFLILLCCCRSTCQIGFVHTPSADPYRFPPFYNNRSDFQNYSEW